MSSQATHAAICRAIAGHHLLTLMYGGEQRMVQPYIYGRDSHDHELLSAYQVTGGSASGQHSGWKLFDTTRLDNVKVLPARFSELQSAYNPADPTFKDVYSQI